LTNNNNASTPVTPNKSFTSPVPANHSPSQAKLGTPTAGIKKNLTPLKRPMSNSSFKSPRKVDPPPLTPPSPNTPSMPLPTTPTHSPLVSSSATTPTVSILNNASRHNSNAFLKSPSHNITNLHSNANQPPLLANNIILTGANNNNSNNQHNQHNNQNTPNVGNSQHNSSANTNYSPFKTSIHQNTTLENPSPNRTLQVTPGQFNFVKKPLVKSPLSTSNSTPEHS
jgi:hypothetical protein